MEISKQEYLDELRRRLKEAKDPEDRKRIKQVFTRVIYGSNERLADTMQIRGTVTGRIYKTEPGPVLRMSKLSMAIQETMYAK